MHRLRTILVNKQAANFWFVKKKGGGGFLRFWASKPGTGALWEKTAKICNPRNY